MFKNNLITKMEPYLLREESEWFPSFHYPAMLGSGKVVLALDATGFQGLSDKFSKMVGLHAPPTQKTQAETYVLHEGMISQHLFTDECKRTNTSDPRYGQKLNFMPFGYLKQTINVNGANIADEDIYENAERWKREINLGSAIITNRIFVKKEIEFVVESFAPYGGESVYFKVTRKARRTNLPAHYDYDISGKCTWQLELVEETKGGLELFSDRTSEKTTKHTRQISIDTTSPIPSIEKYTLLYGIGADGAKVNILDGGGYAINMTGDVDKEQIAYIRLDFCRLAGDDEISAADKRQSKLEHEVAAHGKRAHEKAREAHIKNWADFWGNTADIEVIDGDEFELTRRYMLHFSEYLIRSGSDYGCGGSPQFAFMHLNGWAASNFHDQHYVVDGVAKSNMWDKALPHLMWLKSVMKKSGRAFPWMMVYNGTPTVAPENDIAPMSDAGRAMIAMRLYELSGKKGTLLADYVYPILKRVANMAKENWFRLENGRRIFKPVDLDVTDGEAKEHDASTVLAFLTVIKKAIIYSAELKVDATNRKEWQELADSLYIDVVDGKYQDFYGADGSLPVSGWLCHSYYISECQEFLDDTIYKKTVDFSHERVWCNIAWIGYAVASSELRLGRPDRAEAYCIDHLENRLHGPGYFEECYPLWGAAMPPFASAHGAHLTTSVEQIVLSDMWENKIAIATTMPTNFKAHKLRFSNLRARDGIIVSGNYSPKSIEVTLFNSGDALREEDIVVGLPSRLGIEFTVYVNGEKSPYIFMGDRIKVNIAIKSGKEIKILIKEKERE